MTFVLEAVLTKSYFSRVARQLWNFFEKFGTKGFNEVFPVMTGQGNNFEMPPEYNDKLRLFLVPFRLVENVEHSHIFVYIPTKKSGSERLRPLPLKIQKPRGVLDNQTHMRWPGYWKRGSPFRLVY